MCVNERKKLESVDETEGGELELGIPNRTSWN